MRLRLWSLRPVHARRSWRAFAAFLVLLALVIFAEYAVARTLMDIGTRLHGSGALV